MAVSIGDKAPDFTLPDQNGQLFTLSKIIGSGTIILYFYPKDETPGCTAEACSFRDNMTDFNRYDATVIGISQDSVDSHARFADHHGLNFTLLSDVSNKVRTSYGVKPTFFGLIPGRKTYIIDKQGIISYIFDHQFKARRHVTEALQAIAND